MQVTTVNGYTWALEGSRLILRMPRTDLFWDMPAGFLMPTPSTLSAAEYILFETFRKNLKVEPFIGERKRGTALAFSGGIDSAAALRLLPDPIPIYAQNHDWPITLENALMSVKEVGGLAIVTNQNQLPKEFGKGLGYYGFGGFSVPSILLSEHFGFDTLSDGNIIEFIYLYDRKGHGTKFNPRSFKRFHNALAISKLFYCMPVSGMTEISTTRIAKGFQYAMGCTKGKGGKPCLKCLKCYRKEAIVGNVIPPNPAVEKAFSGPAIPVLATYIWAAKHHGLSHPKLEPFLEKDISWVDEWYPASLEHVPMHLRPHVLSKLAEYDIPAMTDTAAIENWEALTPP